MGVLQWLWGWCKDDGWIVGEWEERTLWGRERGDIGFKRKSGWRGAMRSGIITEGEPSPMPLLYD